MSCVGDTLPVHRPLLKELSNIVLQYQFYKQAVLYKSTTKLESRRVVDLAGLTKETTKRDTRST